MEIISMPAGVRYNYVSFEHYWVNRTSNWSSKGVNPVSFRRDLTETEVTLAFVMGGGLTLLILGFTLAAIQSGNKDFPVTRLDILMIVGLVLFIGGVFAWLVVSQPWQYFDDWSKPLYTGHVHDVHEAA